jgi:sigma-B regulation protein RsbU (phosphoserine phosphatase)
VVVSGQDDDELARSVLAVGADDYLVKARAAGQILVRLATAKRIVDLEDQQRHQHVALQEALKELQQANHVMKLDLARAGALQKLQLPDNAGTLPGLRYSAAYKPCETLGGDHYGAFALGRDRSLVFLLDAAGHGVSAALLALQANRQIVSAQGRLRMEGDGPAALLELVTDLNDTFQQRRISSYFTLFCAIIDAQHQHVTAISCGHPAAVRLRGQQAELLASRSPAIGLLPSSGAQWDIQQFDFQDDEHLVLYSDGLIESENETGDFFEHDLLIASLQAGQQAGASDLAHQLMNALEAWRGASPVQDDASVLALNLRAAVA